MLRPKGCVATHPFEYLGLCGSVIYLINSVSTSRFGSAHRRSLNLPALRVKRSRNSSYGYFIFELVYFDFIEPSLQVEELEPVRSHDSYR